MTECLRISAAENAFKAVKRARDVKAGTRIFELTKTWRFPAVMTLFLNRHFLTLQMTVPKAKKEEENPEWRRLPSTWVTSMYDVNQHSFLQPGKAKDGKALRRAAWSELVSRASAPCHNQLRPRRQPIDVLQYAASHRRLSTQSAETRSTKRTGRDENQ